MDLFITDELLFQLIAIKTEEKGNDVRTIAIFQSGKKYRNTKTAKHSCNFKGVCVLCAFYSVNCKENRLKIILLVQHMEIFITCSSLTGIKFEIWRVTFLKMVDLQSSGNNGNNDRRCLNL